MTEGSDLRQLARAAVEAMLFAAVNPLTVEDMGRASGIPESGVRGALDQLHQSYQEPGCGIALQYVGQGYQVRTRPEFAPIIEQLGRQRQLPTLSRAALETLTVVAYRQPITRAEIEALRGVRTDATLSTLLERGLIAEGGRKDSVGRPILYVTTRLFLTQFGLGEITQLPPLPEDVGEAEG